VGGPCYSVIDRLAASVAAGLHFRSKICRFRPRHSLPGMVRNSSSAGVLPRRTKCFGRLNQSIMPTTPPSDGFPGLPGPTLDPSRRTRRYTRKVRQQPEAIQCNRSRCREATVDMPNGQDRPPLRIGRLDMKFVLVNGRTPRAQSQCELCCQPIGAGFLREIRTRLTYCDRKCYADHQNRAVPVVLNQARASR
jgi:hypothetical protein